MDDFSRQRINFIEVLPVLYKRIPSAWHLLIIWGVTGLLLVLQHVMAGHGHQQLRLDKDSLAANLNAALDKLSGSGGADTKGKLIAVSDNALQLNAVGFYGDLTALAQHYSTHVWFTRIMIDKAQEEVMLEGETNSTQALNDLYAQLAGLPEFAAYSLNLRDIKRMTRTNQSDSVVHSFVITNIEKQYRRGSR